MAQHWNAPTHCQFLLGTWLLARYKDTLVLTDLPATELDDFLAEDPFGKTPHSARPSPVGTVAFGLEFREFLIQPVPDSDATSVVSCRPFTRRRPVTLTQRLHHIPKIVGQRGALLCGDNGECFRKHRIRLRNRHNVCIDERSKNLFENPLRKGVCLG